MATPLAAAAQRSAFELHWSAPRECPSRESVLERLADRVATAGMKAHARIVRRGAGYRLELALEHEDNRSQRTLENAQCGPLAEAAAVLIALAIENERARDQPESEPEPQPEPKPNVVEAPASAAPRPQATSSAPASDTASSAPDSTVPNITRDLPSEGAVKRALHLQLWAAARADLGSFPQQPALGVQAQLVARFAPLFVALGASYWPAREQRSESYPSARLRGSAALGDLSIGFDVSTPTVVLTPALNLELGVLYAEALGIEGPQRSQALWLALGPSVTAAMNVAHDFWLGLELSGLIPAYQTHWLVRTPQGGVPAFDAAPLVLRIGLRVGYTLR